MFPDHPRAEKRLEEEDVIWLTTVGRDGQPQSSPVWFLIDSEEFLVYSLPDTSRVRNIRNNPRVALNLDGNGEGGDIVTVEGRARLDHDAPSAAGNDAYLAKYRARMDRNGWTPEWFASRYSTPIRITFEKGRAW